MEVNSQRIDVTAIARQFACPGEFVGLTPHSGGHINDSYRAEFRTPSGSYWGFLQRINPAVFPDAEAITENLLRVTGHIAAKLQRAGSADWRRRVLTPIVSHDGRYFVRDQDNAAWRMFEFITDTRVHLQVRTPQQAEQAGEAFGRFQRQIADLPPPPLKEVLPGFHDTPARLAALDFAVTDAARDPRLAVRLAEVAAELRFIAARRAGGATLMNELRTGRLPLRSVHNDAKLSNVLLDAQTGEALCVTDLDLVMPGTVLFDFGDMQRSMLCAAPEDEPDLARVTIDPELFDALARGYLAATREFLMPRERELLVVSGIVITLEQGVRFLTDYLRGDSYYHTTRPNQNLDRARVQLRLVEQLETWRSEFEERL